MTITPDTLRADLAELSKAAAQSSGAADKIKDAARDMRKRVNGMIEELRPKVLTDDSAADEYQRLIADRGQLDIIIGS